MSRRVLHPEWRNSHELTNYPFHDTATLSNGVQFIPEFTLLDAIIHPVGGQHGAYISRVDVDSEYVTVHIGDNGTQQRCYGTFQRHTTPESLRLVDNYGRPAGLLVSDGIRMAAFAAMSDGQHTFRPEHTEFVASVVMPQPAPGLRGFILDDGSVVTDDVWLMGDDGVVLRAESPTTIRVDVVGDPLSRRRLCDTTFEIPQFVRRITVRSGGHEQAYDVPESGEFSITTAHQDAVQPVLRVRTVDGALEFSAAGDELASE